MNTKIIPAFLLIIVLGTGFIAYKFYTEKGIVVNDNIELINKNEVLQNENDDFQNKFINLQNEKFDLERRVGVIQQELDLAQNEANSLKNKFNNMTRQRDELVQRLESSAPVTQVISESLKKGPISAQSDWVDFVEKKAFAEARLGNLKKKFFQIKTKLTELDTKNKELSMRISQFYREKEQIIADKKFKERALRVMSMDLVSEREQRAMAVKEAVVLRSENVDLKRSIILANKEKLVLAKDLNAAIEKKEIIENRIADAESVLRQKTLIFGELKEQLEMAIFDEKKSEYTELTSVELPPIVVKPNLPGLKAIQGEVVAVNRDENFVVVNIGEDTGVLPGAELKVLRGDKMIATLEVIESRKEISAADIKRVIGNYVIQQGDKVVNK